MSSEFFFHNSDFLVNIANKLSYQDLKQLSLVDSRISVLLNNPSMRHIILAAAFMFSWPQIQKDLHQFTTLVPEEFYKLSFPTKKDQEFERFILSLNIFIAKIQTVNRFFEEDKAKYFANKFNTTHLKNNYYNNISRVDPFNDETSITSIYFAISQAKENIEIYKIRVLKEQDKFYGDRYKYWLLLTLTISTSTIIGALYIPAIIASLTVITLTLVWISIPLIMMIVTSVCLWIAYEQNKKEKEEYFNHMQNTLDEFHGHLERILASNVEEHLEQALEVSDSNTTLLSKNIYRLIKQPNKYSLYTVSKDNKLLEIPLNAKMQNGIATKLAGQNITTLSKAIINDLKIMLNLDKQSLHQKIIQRDELFNLLMSKKFENTNSTGIKNIQKILNKYPNMSCDNFFTLIQTEINQRGSDSWNSFSFYRDRHRHSGLQKLYTLINGNKSDKPALDLISSTKDRQILINFIENPENIFVGIIKDSSKNLPIIEAALSTSLQV
jgi:hypothetical protein